MGAGKGDRMADSSGRNRAMVTGLESEVLVGRKEEDEKLSSTY